MFGTFHLALMCLLMLALPLQGLAAVTMLHCGPGHSRPAAAPQLKGTKIVKCSACASCCGGALLPSAALLFARFPAVSAPAAWLASLHLGFLADRLGPPPRPLLG